MPARARGPGVKSQPMDGGGRVAQALNRLGPARKAASGVEPPVRRRRKARGMPRVLHNPLTDSRWNPVPRVVRRALHWLIELPIPRGAGLAATALIMLAS